MNDLIKNIVQELKTNISSIYDIKDIKVFGSSARGDYRPDSDIDVFVHLEQSNRKIEEELYDISYDLELKYDCLIDLIILDTKDIAGQIGESPLYRNIFLEGLPV